MLHMQALLFDLLKPHSALHPCTAGHIEIVLPDGSSQRVGVTRAHLEEDAGSAPTFYR